MSNRKTRKNIIPKLQETLDLISAQFPNLQNINSYDNTQRNLGWKDPFFDIQNLDNILEWYKKKNPKYLPLDKIGHIVEVPEFIPIVLILAKDLLILRRTNVYPQRNNNNKPSNKNTLSAKYLLAASNTRKRNNNNSGPSGIIRRVDKILTVVIQFVNIKQQYDIFFQILQDYILLFSTGRLYDEIGNEERPQVNNNTDFAELRAIYMYKQAFDNIYKSAFILYPSFNQLAFDKVLLTMQAPVLNFRILNKRTKIHDSFAFPLFELFHDIDFHCQKTHKYYEKKRIEDTFDYKYSFPSGEELEKRFKFIKSIIDVLKPHIIYSNIPKAKQNNEDYHMRVLLVHHIFYVVHEAEDLKYLLNLQKLIGYKPFFEDSDSANDLNKEYINAVKGNLDALLNLRQINATVVDVVRNENGYPRELYIQLLNEMLETQLQPLIDLVPRQSQLAN